MQFLQQFLSTQLNKLHLKASSNILNVAETNTSEDPMALTEEMARRNVGKFFFCSQRFDFRIV